MFDDEVSARFVGEDLARLREFAQERGVTLEEAVSTIMAEWIQQSVASIFGGKGHMRGHRAVVVQFPVRRAAVA